MPEISIIVPVYKTENYLDRCIRSLIGQTFRDLEILLVDDGSPDRCPQLCDDWAERDGRIRVIHQANGGQGSARNTGLAAAAGKYISFVDSDDWIEPDMLGHLRDLLLAHPDARLAQCDAFICRDERSVPSQPPETVRVLDRKALLDYFFRVHGEASNNNIWNKLYARTLLEGFSFTQSMTEDLEASYAFFVRAEQAVFSSAKLYHYFVNTQGVTKSRFSARNLDYLHDWDNIVERAAADCPDYLEYARMGRKRANFTLLSKMVLQGYDKNDPELSALRRELKRQVRHDLPELLRWKMPVSRKALLILVSL